MCTFPVITLSNGIRVANFSSPHEFNFLTGEVLEACSPEHAKAMMLNAEEIERPNGRWIDIELSFAMSDAVRAGLEEACRLDVDIVLVPFPVMQSVKETDCEHLLAKIRVVRVADRATKAIYSDRFCC